MDRPKFNPALAKYAAEDIVGELVKGGHLEAHQAEDAVADIVKRGGQHVDGYELAKALDDWAHWDCNFEMAEILDGYSRACSHHVERAEKDWAKITAPQPPLSIGARVRLQRSEAGTIDGIYEHGAAKYTVKIDGIHDGSRRIVNFEDVKLLVEASA